MIQPARDLEPIHATPPPHAREVEECVLGCVLNWPDATWPVMRPILGPGADAFWVSSHRRVFSAIEALIGEGGRVDIITVRDRLERQRELAAVGGVAALRALCEAVPTPHSADHYARIVRDRWQRRSVLWAAESLARRVRESDDSGRDLIEQGLAELGAVRDLYPIDQRTPLPELVDRVVRSANESGAPGVVTRLRQLHAAGVSQFCPGELVVIAGRPGHGKTCMMASVAIDVAEDHGRVLVVSLEEQDERFVRRLLAASAGIEKAKLRDARMTLTERDRLDRAAAAVSELPIDVASCRRATMDRVELEAKDAALRGDLRAVVIDYAQRLRIEGRAESRRLEVGEIARRSKQLALDLGVPVFLGSQLSRAGQHGGVEASRPQLHQLRETGELEAEADVVVGVWNRHRSAPEDEWSRGVVELSILKNRDGGVGRVALTWLDGARLWEPGDPRCWDATKSLRAAAEYRQRSRGRRDDQE